MVHARTDAALMTSTGDEWSDYIGAREDALTSNPLNDLNEFHSEIYDHNEISLPHKILVAKYQLENKDELTEDVKNKINKILTPKSIDPGLQVFEQSPPFIKGDTRDYNRYNRYAPYVRAGGRGTMKRCSGKRRTGKRRTGKCRTGKRRTGKRRTGKRRTGKRRTQRR